MAFAQGSRSGLSYITEVTFGTTPAGNFTPLPINTHSINLTKDRVAGNEIRPDRIPRVDRHGNRQIGGDIVGDLRQGAWDDFIAAAMLSDWASDDTIGVGTTPKFFSIEDAFNDVAQYRLFTGCTVSTLNISVAPNQMVTSTFGIVGKDLTISGTGKTLNTLTTTQPFDAYSGDLFLQDAGSTNSAVTSITSIDFTINNSFNPTFVIGDDSTPQLEYGRAEVEGTITAYFEDASLANRFLNETESELEFSVNDPTGLSPYTFTFPRIKINGSDVPLENPQSRVITIPFVALFDSTLGTNLQITRTS
ncbi:MAG TPA: phage tail tube protein [Candidatus Obscuribacterales bacterium]